MIRINVGIVLLITDGYTLDVPNGKGFIFLIDGIEKKAISKPGGYYVFTDISDGKHEIVIRSAQYQEERIITEKSTEVIPVVLKPGSRYPYGLGAVWVTFNCQENYPNGVWISQSLLRTDIKLIQPDLEAGADKMRLFFDEGASRLKLPQYFMIEDEDQTEICMFEKLEKYEASQIKGRLAMKHKRGCRLFPAQHYDQDERKQIRFAVNEKKELCIWIPDKKKLYHIDTRTETTMDI